jgi:hypothetical protein
MIIWIKRRRNNMKIEKPEHIFDEEYRIRDKGGNIKWIHAKTYPIFDTNGNYIRNTGIAKDITAYKQLEDISDRLNEALSKKVDEETQKRKERELAFEGIFDIAGSCLCIINDIKCGISVRTNSYPHL